MKHILIILSLFLMNSHVFSQNTHITSFSKSKKLLLKLYKAHPVTLYCGCSFNGKKPDLSSCGYIPKKDNKRANRIEWEHVVPAHAFGQSFPEWRVGHPKCVSKKGKKYKGRRCAEKVDKQYRRMQADMYNLYPAIGEVNGRRSNYSMAIIEGEKREFGKCVFATFSKNIKHLTFAGCQSEIPLNSSRFRMNRKYCYQSATKFSTVILTRVLRSILQEWVWGGLSDWEELESRFVFDVIQDFLFLLANGSKMFLSYP